jgi:hypothetical protein
MRLKSALFALPLSLLLLAPNASFAETVTLHFIGTGGVTDDGLAVFPYDFNITSGSTTIASDIALSCLDFDRDITNGESWTATVTTLSSTSNFTLLEQAYLDSLYGKGDSNGEIQLAIWDLEDPNSQTLKHDLDSVSKGLLSAVAGDVNNLLATDPAFFSQFTDYTPSGSERTWTDGEPQDFLQYTPVTVSSAPEPSSLLLFGTGLLGTVGMLRRRILKPQTTV